MTNTETKTNKLAACPTLSGGLADKLDAERYRWLRNRFNNNWSGPYFELLEGRGCFELKQGGELDAAIDAAMAPNA